MSDRPKKSLRAKNAAETGLHPVSIEIALGAALWFLLVTWVSFAGGGETDWDLVVVTLLLGFFFALLLVAASFIADDPRWRLPKSSFCDFLGAQISTETGRMRGRDALVEITIVPVSLALAATAIGFLWILLR